MRAKNYISVRQNGLFMKIDNLVVGIIVVAVAALFLADAILTTNDPASQVLSPNDVKGIVGMVFLVLAGWFFYRTAKG
jgi:hypothetical protein